MSAKRNKSLSICLKLKGMNGQTEANSSSSPKEFVSKYLKTQGAICGASDVRESSSGGNSIGNNSANRKRRTRRRCESFDPMLIPRIEKFMEDNTHRRCITIDEMASSLQRRHMQYRRIKLPVFRQSVEKAFNIFAKKYNEEGSGESEDSKVEDASAEEVKEVDFKVNSHIRNLYSKKLAPPESEKSEVSLANMDTDCQIMDELVNPTREASSEMQVDLGNSHEKEASESRSVAAAEENSCETKPTENNVMMLDTQLPSDNVRKQQPEASGSRKKAAVPDGEVIPSKKRRKEIAAVQKPKVTFKDIGISEHSLMMICRLVFHLKHPSLYQHMGAKPPRGLLLHGPPGCGKTLLASAIAGEFELPMLKVGGTEIVAGVTGESEEKIRDLFAQAQAQAPCILFLDEMDAISSRREMAQREMERRIVTQLLACMDELGQPGPQSQVLVIGATSRPESLDPALRMSGRLDYEVCLGIPDEAARAQILGVLSRGLQLAPDVDLFYLARFTPGYMGADLQALITWAAMHAMDRTLLPPEKEGEKTSTMQLEAIKERIKSENPVSEQELQSSCIQKSDFEAALKVMQPSAKREGFATVPEVTWEDVGALKEVRKKLEMAIVAPVHHPEKFAAMGLTRPTGILLCGPPGCGKTFLAKAIANEAGINFISVKGPELFNMYVGESERAVRQCFQRARNSAPCVIFFDELDALCPKRTDAGEAGSGTRVVNQLLTEMDGMGLRKGVFLMAATNRPDIIDPAILRPGRMDQVLYLGLPSPEDRAEILQAITKFGKCPPIADDVDFTDLARSERCEGFTGADLSNLVKEAATLVVQESLLQEKLGGVLNSDWMKVKRHHFLRALENITPSVLPTERKHYEKFRNMFAVPVKPDVLSSPIQSRPSSPVEEAEVEVVESGESEIEVI